MDSAGFASADWSSVIADHPLESGDPHEWLRYGVALLQTLTPGPDAGRQQQQAALAFVQAQKHGAGVEAVMAAQRESVRLSLAQAVVLAGVMDAASLSLSLSLSLGAGQPAGGAPDSPGP